MATKKKTATSAGPGRGRGRKPLPEDPREAFNQAAEIRLNKVLDSLKTLGSLSGPRYDYDEEVADKMVEDIQNALNACARRLSERPTGATSTRQFSYLQNH